MKKEAGRSIAQRIYNSVSAVLLFFPNTIRTWHDRSRGRRYLAQMDTRMLKDVGMTEADRLNELGKPFWQK